ncbi:MAG: DmsC/YnfH family molybdoenzyme membrane anchor subunit [Desulfovibrionaceae bacterium]
MLANEWSLVLFTILAQTAIGMLLVSEIARMMTESPAKLFTWQLPVISAITGVSLLLSLAHLGTPLHSMFTMFNAGTSWLSREILTTCGFFASVLALTFLRHKTPEAKATALSLLAVFFGLATVFAMSRVYMLTTIPVWDSISTMLGFYGTMLISGSIAGGLLFGIQNNLADMTKEDLNRITGMFIIAAVIGLALKFVGIPLDMVALDATNSMDVSGIELMASGGLIFLAARTVLIFLGTALFAWAAFKIITSTEGKAMTNLSLCAFGLVFVGEIIGRIMFYGTYLRIGI